MPVEAAIALVAGCAIAAWAPIRNRAVACGARVAFRRRTALFQRQAILAAADATTFEGASIAVLILVDQVTLAIDTGDAFTVAFADVVTALLPLVDAPAQVARGIWTARTAVRNATAVPGTGGTPAVRRTTLTFCASVRVGATGVVAGSAGERPFATTEMLSRLPVALTDMTTAIRAAARVFRAVRAAFIRTQFDLTGQTGGAANLGFRVADAVSGAARAVATRIGIGAATLTARELPFSATRAGRVVAAFIGTTRALTTTAGVTSRGRAAFVAAEKVGGTWVGGRAGSRRQ